MQSRSTKVARNGVIVRHMMGEYSLGRSYWFHTVAVGWALTASVGAVIHWIGRTHPARDISIAILAYIPVAALVWIWSTFGTTVSALRRLLSGPGRLWAVIALLVLFFSSAAALRQLPFLTNSVREHWAVANGYQPGDSFVVDTTKDGRVVRFQGGVQDGAAIALEKAISNAPEALTIQLNSPGGWLREGQRMAEVIKRYNLNTKVKGECMSACTVVLLAGVNRIAEPGSVVGFHRGRSVGESGRVRTSATNEELAIYLESGVSRSFADRIMRTPNEDFWVPNKRELLEGGILTE